MSIKIRLARAGSKKRPFYRVVAADSRMPRDGRFIEKLGTYNPLLNKDDSNRVKLDLDKIKEWLSKGAQTTDRISRLLENLEVLPKKVRNNPIKAKPKKEAEEISLKQQEIVNRMPFIPMMTSDDRIDFFDAMLDLIERQKIFYMRLNLSDDPMAKDLMAEFRRAATVLGMDTDGLDMLGIYDKFRDNMENVRQQVLDGEL